MAVVLLKGPNICYKSAKLLLIEAELCLKGWLQYSSKDKLVHKCPFLQQPHYLILFTKVITKVTREIMLIVYLHDIVFAINLSVIILMSTSCTYAFLLLCMFCDYCRFTITLLIAWTNIHMTRTFVIADSSILLTNREI